MILPPHETDQPVPSSHPNDTTHPVPAKQPLHLGWVFGFGLVLVYMAGWVFLPQAVNNPDGLTLRFLLVFVCQGLAVVIFQSAMEPNLARISTSMRASLGVSLAIGAILCISWWVSPQAEPASELALVALAGTGLGVLAQTWLRFGLWEDNFPPSAAVLDEVHRFHRDELGENNPPSSGGKRIFDLLLAAIGLIPSLPILALIAAIIWLEDPGPFLFVKNSVGKGGKNFHQYKFRTMIRDAERSTGPVMADLHDQRVLWIGRFLRKTALDELPQLFNILSGEMSFVGPRPQRTILVRDTLKQVPGYAERHLVAPGLAGLAQVMGSYYISQEEKLKWDRIYIDRMSLGFDLRIILLAFAIVFWYRWQKEWDEKNFETWLGLGDSSVVQAEE